MMIHPQVDSGHGFTCDEEILPFIEAFYEVGLTTLGSCQGIHAWSPSVVINQNPKATGFPRRWVAYTHSNPQAVFVFALYIRQVLPEIDGWSQTIHIDHYSVPDTVYGTLEFVPNLDSRVLEVIKSWGL
jgi:hypothetical protein